MLPITWPLLVEDTPMKVGSTPSIAHGWRPYSATIQPSSAASHGSGRLHRAMRRKRGFSSLRLLDSRKAQANRAMKKKPSATMIRNEKNSTGTFGTVSQAARSITDSSALAGSSTYLRVSRPKPRSWRLSRKAWRLAGSFRSARTAASAAWAWMPLRMRCLLCSTRSWMPGTCSSSERVAIRPSAHGMRTAALVSRACMLGMPNRVNEAGAGVVCHSASIAATFMCWFSEAV